MAASFNTLQCLCVHSPHSYKKENPMKNICSSVRFLQPNKCDFLNAFGLWQQLHKEALALHWKNLPLITKFVYFYENFCNINLTVHINANWKNLVCPPSLLISISKCLLWPRDTFLHCPAEHPHSHTVLQQFIWSSTASCNMIKGKNILNLNSFFLYALVLLLYASRWFNNLDCSEQLINRTVNFV